MKRAIDIDKKRRIEKMGTPIHRRKTLGDLMITTKKGGKFNTVRAEAILEFYGCAEAGKGDVILWVHMAEEPFPTRIGYRVGNFKLYDIKVYEFRHGLDVYNDITNTREAMNWVEKKQLAKRGSL